MTVIRAAAHVGLRQVRPVSCFLTNEYHSKHARSDAPAQIMGLGFGGSSCERNLAADSIKQTPHVPHRLRSRNWARTAISLQEISWDRAASASTWPDANVRHSG